MRSSVLKYGITLAFVVAPLHPRLSAAPAEKAAAASTFRLERFLWRPVEDNQGHKLGAISDVLAEMPSGKIVFVLVEPNRPYAEPKAVPPSALFVPADQKLPIRLDITSDRWMGAPHLGWDPQVVVKSEDEGAKIYGYYQQRWLGTMPHPNNVGMNVVATRNGPATGQPAPLRFVSLKRMHFTRVAASSWKQEGFLCGFLVDWRQQRVSHALISRLFPVIQPASEPWYAIPVSLLSPPVERDALTVSSPAKAFEQAPALKPGSPLPEHGSSEIFQYPNPTPALTAAERSSR